MGVAVAVSFLARSRSPAPGRSLIPRQAAAFTSSREVTSLLAAPDGTVWIGTLGGVLRRNREGRWQKFTRRDGLPAHEARGFRVEKGEVVALFPQATATWRDGTWQVRSAVQSPPMAGLLEQQTCATSWRGAAWVATATRLRVRKGTAWR